MNKIQPQTGGVEISNQNPENKTEFFAMVQDLISFLPKRSQDIIKKRYGLNQEKGETLEKIGQEYEITRERVRQIISDALKHISEKLEESNFKKAQERLIFTIGKNNGIIKETEIVSKFNLDGFREANSIKFFADCSRKISAVQEKGIVERSWVLDEAILEKVLKVGKAAETVLEKKKDLLTSEEISQNIALALSEVSKEEILSILPILHRVQKNKFNKWGLRNWPEVNPKGTREKIYLVLKEKNKPLHFTEIAKAIDEFQLGKRKAHPQTVHNELIKDGRFVLIGRGIYALAQWGYSDGTIKDVLKNILSESKKPLSKEEILAKVLKMRKVKKTTVMINLNDRKVFEKNKDLYTIKK